MYFKRNIIILDEFLTAGHGKHGNDKLKCGFYRAERPESSTGAGGKQGMVYKLLL